VKTTLQRGLALGLTLAVGATAASAQRRARGGAGVGVPPPSVGPLLGYDFDVDHVFLGGVFNIPVARRFTLRPSMEFYTGSTGTPYRLNVDLKYHPPTAVGLFYFGGGLAILHSSGNNDTGVNAFAGWEGRRARPFRPFAEAKLVFASSTSFNLLGGIAVPL